jgi:DNA-binding LacI/PurR family transcriptional regulator
LIERLQGTRTDSNRVITLPVKLIVRESTARKKI